ncbi:hypothetical protein [Agromyces albus]|uniref:hypothetical protein n=1 Tax=Agromyces albus TaxID=205332 RepID=UPI0027887621|nr:hypothetical protein [Agromyces albus]MDQ0573916.1 hypothetical protein [Agromyces albus]
MERIHYGSHVFHTGTEIAGAVLDYAGLLAAAGRFATIDMPIVDVDGGPSRARLLLGPSMPIASESMPDVGAEFRDEGALEALRGAARQLSPPTMRAAAPASIDRRKSSMIDDWLELEAY